MKRIVSFSIFVLLTSALCAQELDFSWEQIPMDGSRVGAVIPNVSNWSESLGTVKGKKFIAPNGHKYKGSVAEVASLMLDAQPAMTFVKELVGHSPVEMVSRSPQSALSNMIVDRLMVATGEAVGKHIDVGITNFGGIRVSMPEGDVILDDIVSMLPFKNYLCCLELQGSDVRVLLEQFAEKPQVLGGVKITVRDGKLVSAFVGDEPLDDSRIYNVATVDFLLDGGDNVFVARNAKSLEVTDVLICDALLSYIRQLKDEGREIEYSVDDRYIILD